MLFSDYAKRYLLVVICATLGHGGMLITHQPLKILSALLDLVII